MSTMLYVVILIAAGIGYFLYMKKKGAYNPNTQFGFASEEKIVFMTNAQYNIPKDGKVMAAANALAGVNERSIVVHIAMSDKNNLAIKESEKQKRLFSYAPSNKPTISELEIEGGKAPQMVGYGGKKEEAKLIEFKDAERTYQLFVPRSDADKIIDWARN